MNKPHDNNSQMRLGVLIDTLKSMPEDAEVALLHNPHSYRGYHNELAFHIQDGKQSAKALLAVCEEILNSSMRVYKDGDFIISSSVPVWVANYGDLGHMLMGFGDDGQALLED